MTNRLQKSEDRIGVKCKMVVYISKGVIKGKKSVFSKVRRRFLFYGLKNDVLKVSSNIIIGYFIL